MKLKIRSRQPHLGLHTGEAADSKKLGKKVTAYLLDNGYAEAVEAEAVPAEEPTETEPAADAEEAEVKPKLRGGRKPRGKAGGDG